MKFPSSIFLYLILFLPFATYGQTITSITIDVTTADVWTAGTDDDVHLMLWASSGDGKLVPKDWNLDNPGNDFERGDTNTFRLTANMPKDVCNIRMIKIWKSSDGVFGGWKLGGIRIYYNDNPSLLIYQNNNINQWLEDNHRDWLASNFEPIDCKTPLPPPPPPPKLPDKCYIKKWDSDGEFYTKVLDTDCDGIADVDDPNPKIPAKDSDGDGIADPREKLIGTDPNNADTDGDGIFDGHEDENQNGVMDPGETDPKKSDTDSDGIPDGQEDSDNDGLPDWYEWNSDPNNPDSDGDGWYDGPKNVRTFLLLYRIECGDESEDVEGGDDELFLVVNDVRFPADSEDLDGYWDMEGGDVIFPMTVVGHRVRSPKQTPSYKAIVQLWEDDWFDWTDDHWQTDTISFGDSGTVDVVRNDLSWYNDTIYKVTFLSYSEYFYDSNPSKADADPDHDGLTDKQEYEISSDAKLRGMSDPLSQDIFMEMEWVGSDEEPEPYSKIDVVSQFYYHGYPIHLDDGDYGGGGETISYIEQVYLRPNGTPSAEQIADKHFAVSRRGKFHYVLGVDVPGEFKFGVSSGPNLNDKGAFVCGNKVGLMIFKSDYLDHISDMESILFMHELGHTFGLCHRPNDPIPTVAKGNVCPGTNPADCAKCDNCTHYWIDQSSDTAMGSGLPFEWGGAVVGGFAGGAIGFGVSGPIGTVIGGIGGLLAGGFFSDPLDREIRYEKQEWDALNLDSIKHW